LVTRQAPTDKACAAIKVSIGPIGEPDFSRQFLITPYSAAAPASKGRISKGSRNSWKCFRFFSGFVLFAIPNSSSARVIEEMQIDNAASFSGGTGISDYDSSELIYGTTFDDNAYNDAMNQYDFDKYTYEKAVSDINAETSQIQSKDKALELKLKQLDSEHSAIQTELEAVKNVITKNIEGTFKTFGG